jgi:hypothetical protein
LAFGTEAPDGSRTTPEMPASPAAACAIKAGGARTAVLSRTHKYTRFIEPPDQALNVRNKITDFAYSLVTKEG